MSMIIPALIGAGASLLQKNPYQGLINQQTQMAKAGGAQYRQYTPQINQQWASIMNGNLPPQYEAFYNQMMDSINKQFMSGRQDLQGELAGSGMSSGLMKSILDTYLKGGANASSNAAYNSMLQRWGAMDNARGQLAGNVNTGMSLGTSAAGQAGNLMQAGQQGQAAQMQGLMQMLQQYGMLDAWKKFQPQMPPGPGGGMGVGTGGGLNTGGFNGYLPPSNTDQFTYKPMNPLSLRPY